MNAIPVEVLLGIYLGLLTGILPAFVAGALGFVVRYVTGVTLPGFGVVVLALAIASINGGLLVLAEREVLSSPRLLAAVLVVIMLALYAHSQGDKLGAELPRRVSFTSVRKRTLSADVVEFVGNVGQVTVHPTGEIRDMEGYPPLAPDLRSTIREGFWRLPADLPLSELESRLADRLRTDYDLADVSVAIDEQGRATITAAPPSSGLSRRVPDGRRAVSIDALVPTGLARGDEVDLLTSAGTVAGTVLSVRASGDEVAAPADDDDSDEAATDGGVDDETESQTARATPASAGGEGRVTVAVTRRDARTLLRADRGHVVVGSRATSREFEALSLLHGEDHAVRRLVVGDAGAPVTADSDVTVLAVRRHGRGRDGERPLELERTTAGDGARPAFGTRIRRRLGLADREDGTRSETDRRGWTFAPGIERRLEAGDEVFVAGPEEALDRFAEVAG